jgi:hypothetical protein
MSTVLEQSANIFLSSLREIVDPAVVKHADPSTHLIKFEGDDLFEPVCSTNERPHNNR